MKNKKEKFNSFITFGVFLVFTGALIYQTLPENENQEIVQKNLIEMETKNISHEIPEIEPIRDSEWDSNIDEDKHTSDQSFDEAFASARFVLGKGQTFFWNGNEYSTNLAEEIHPVTTKNDQLIAGSTQETSYELIETDVKKISTSQGIISVK